MEFASDTDPKTSPPGARTPPVASKTSVWFAASASRSEATSCCCGRAVESKGPDDAPLARAVDYRRATVARAQLGPAQEDLRAAPVGPVVVVETSTNEQV